MLLVASETGHVYTYATKKLQPMISSEPGKALIQTCLNAPGGEGSDIQPSRTEFTFDAGNGNGMRKRKMMASSTVEESSNNSPSVSDLGVCVCERICYTENSRQKGRDTKMASNIYLRDGKSAPFPRAPLSGG